VALVTSDQAGSGGRWALSPGSASPPPRALACCPNRTPHFRRRGGSSFLQIQVSTAPTHGHALD
jgi:hypothetical protein